MPLTIAICGSRYFGATVFEALHQEPGVAITSVVVPEADDRLAQAARKAGVPVHVQADPKHIPAEALAADCDVLVAAHTHARVADAAIARARLGGVGYHPSLLPRHRGIAAVEWTILAGDPIAGGSVYHLAAGWDAGPIAAQDWCFVGREDTARALWERELAPMGIRLLQEVVRHARDKNALPAKPQNTAYATKAPMLRRAVKLAETGPEVPGQVVATVIGEDRPGIVSLLADKAQRQGANWAGSFMANMAGEFAGIVQFEVPPAQQDALVSALQGLESTGLKLAVAKGHAAASGGRRAVDLELVGEDRPGIISELANLLAQRNVSIDQLQTEVAPAGADGKPTFKVKASVQVPGSVDLEVLRGDLGGLARKLMLDIGLGKA